MTGFFDRPSSCIIRTRKARAFCRFAPQPQGGRATRDSLAWWDSLFSCMAAALTAGATDWAREKIYGPGANKGRDETACLIGSLLGAVLGFVLGFAAGAGVLAASPAILTGIAVWMFAMWLLGAGQSLSRMWEGTATGWDLLSLIPGGRGRGRQGGQGGLQGARAGVGRGARGGRRGARARRARGRRRRARGAPRGTGARFGNNARRQDHFNRHGGDFGATSATQYEAMADGFLTGRRQSGVLERVRPNGDVVRFNPATNEFGVVSGDGTIRTYYKPDPAVHGHATNLDYFNAQ